MPIPICRSKGQNHDKLDNSPGFIDIAVAIGL